MKHLVLSMMALAIGFASIAQDQSKEHRKHQKGEKKEWKKEEGKEYKSKGHRYGKLGQDLNLSETQQSQMKALNESFRAKMQSLKNENLSGQEQGARRRELAQEHRNQVLAILTPEQRQKLEEKRAQGEFKGKDGQRFDKGEKKEFKKGGKRAARAQAV